MTKQQPTMRIFPEGFGHGSSVAELRARLNTTHALEQARVRRMGQPRPIATPPPVAIPDFSYIHDQLLIDAATFAWRHFPDWRVMAAELVKRKIPISFGDPGGKYIGVYYPTRRTIVISPLMQAEWVGALGTVVVHEVAHAQHHWEGKGRQSARDKVENEVTAMEWEARAWRTYGRQCPTEMRSAYARHLDRLVAEMEQKRLVKYLLAHEGYEEHIFGGLLPKK